MMKVALYARVSTEDQDNTNQVIRLEEYARLRGFEIYRVYKDVASGANAKRPALDAMMDDARRGKFGHILATKLDRIMRSTINLLEITTNLEKWGVGLAFLDQPIDTTTPVGRLMQTLLSAMAEFERELGIDRTLDGMAKARRNGKRIGRPRKTLSDYQRKKLDALLEKEPNLSIRRIADHFDGISKSRMAEILKEEGIR